VRLWDAATGQQIGPPFSNDDAMAAQARFSPDGARVVAALSDKTARLWDAKTDTKNLVSSHGDCPALPNASAARGPVPAARATHVVCRDGEVALQHPRMETVARRQARSQEPSAACRVLIPEEAAPQFLDDAAPHNGMMPPPDSEMIAPPISE
jgi:hypothetical protein